MLKSTSDFNSVRADKLNIVKKSAELFGKETETIYKHLPTTLQLYYITTASERVQ